MTPAELAADLRTRINPVYAAQLGTESYERRLCAEAIEGLIAELAALNGQQAIGSVTVSPWRGLENIEWQQSADIPEGTHMLFLAAGAQPYSDSTAELSVGDSLFEGWFSEYSPANKGTKQQMRDAYAAGMGDPLVIAAGAQPVPSSKYPCKLTDAELADPEYMRSYIEAMNQDYADLLYAQLVQAPEQRKEQP